eukprot:jgi/Ulvmu1/8571/UM045_0013.1
MARPGADDAPPSTPQGPRRAHAADVTYSSRHPEISLPQAPSEVLASQYVGEPGHDAHIASQQLPPPVVTLQRSTPKAQKDRDAQGSLVTTSESDPDPGSPVVQEDVALLLELRDARPGMVARAVTTYPIPCMLIVLALAAAASVLPFLQPPSINASFETLTVQDQPVNDALSASKYLLSGSDSFWSDTAAAQASSAPATSAGTVSGDAVSRRLLSFHHIPPLPEPRLEAPARQLQDATDVPFRNNIDFALHVVFFNTDKSTMLARETVARIKRVEDSIYALPAYTRMCLHMSERETGAARHCRRPVSMTNFVYGRFADDGSFMADGSATEAQDPVKAAQVLAAQGATFFFDQDADFVRGTSSTLRTEFIFGLPATGTDGSYASGRDVYEELCKDMYDILAAADTGEFRVTFGGDVMTDWEIRQQLLSDSRYVAIALAIAVVMLALATRSPVLTAAALLQIVASFPIAYSLYAATGNTSLSVIQFLSPFVILGIGLDDVFVFVGIYRALLAYSHRFDITTRLHVAWRRASGAMLATSATSAVAFAANAISPVPAVRLFGILLAALVGTNYVLAVVWLPVSVVAWERYVLPCCGGICGGGAAPAAPEAEATGALSHGVPIKAAAPTRPGFLCSGRHFWRVVFAGVWRARVVLIPGLLGASVAGAIFASRLEPSDSLPQLFDDDHNVQQFLNVWAANFTDDSIFACATCLLLSTSVDLDSIDEVQLDFAPPGNTNGTAGGTVGTGTAAGGPGGGATTGASPAAGTPAGNGSAPAGAVANLSVPAAAASPPAIAAQPPPAVSVSTPAAPAPAPVPTDLLPLLVGGVTGGIPPSTPAGAAGSPPAVSNTTSQTLNTTTAGTPAGGGAGVGVPAGGLPGGAPALAPTAALDPAAAPGPAALTAAQASPLDAVSVDEEVLTAERVNLNTIPVAVIWGVRDVGGSNSSDPFSEDAAGTVELDVAFDLGEVAQQKAVLTQVSDLVDRSTGRPQPGRDNLVSKMRWNVLEALQRFCSGPAMEAFYCLELDAETQLPVGDAFHIAAWAMLLSGYQGSFSLSGRAVDYKRSIGFDFEEWTEATSVDRLQLVPRVRWLRLEFASATRETAPPADILDSYNDWTAWRDSVEEMGVTRMMVASEVWVQAVTDAALTEGIVWGIVLSSLFAMVSVYVFTGSVVVMALAAATMVCINTLILGLYHVMGWRLGAIEGVSITVLVGLSVDFSIHFSEAFVRSRLIGRRDRAQDATMLMGTPVLSSAVSTVATALPLWLTATIALRQFAVIISISLSASFIFALLMLVPLLGMFGPKGRDTVADGGNATAAARCMEGSRVFFSSRLHRAAIACTVSLLLMIAVPESRRMLEEVPVIGWVHIAVIAATVLRGVGRIALAAGRGDPVIPAVLGGPAATTVHAGEAEANRYAPGEQ